MSDGSAAVENLPTPGAVREWGHFWVPTLDGEPISVRAPYPYRSREEAWAEAIRWVKHRAGLAIEVKLGDRRGCVLSGDESVIVETVAKARKAILRHAMRAVADHARDAESREQMRLRCGKGRPTWNDLAKCEEGRRYDPHNAEAGMNCCYLLYQHGPLGVVGGGAWAYEVWIWATAPPSVWDHPADQPVGLDNVDEMDDDLADDPGPK